MREKKETGGKHIVQTHTQRAPRKMEQARKKNTRENKPRAR